MTTVDGSGLNDSVVKCISGEGPDTVLDGFTITGGSAENGGGMYTFESSPMVTNCILWGDSPDEISNGGKRCHRQLQQRPGRSGGRHH